MKQQVLYIHGGDSFNEYEKFLDRLRTMTIRDLPGKPKVKWTHTLAEDLGDDFEVFIPRMPNPNNAKYEEWKIWFERHFEYLHDGVILMGCSLGAMFLYKYFIENEPPMKVKALVLMAGVAQVDNFNFDDCGDFLCDLEDVPKLGGKAREIHIMHSKDDFLVPYEHALKFAAALPQATLHTFEDKNHFLVEELPELVDLIKKVSSE